MPIDVPDYVSEAARRGLEWHKDGKSGDGVTEQTLREAREMASGSVSEDKVRRMGPWFQRHRPDMDAPKNKPSNEDFPGAGAVAWALWGGPTSGDIMRTADWAEAKVKQLDADKDIPNSANASMSKITPEAEVAELRTVALALTAERDDLRATVEKLTVGAADELTAVKAEVVTKDAMLADLNARLEISAKEIDSLKAIIAEAQANKVTASQEAAKIVASVGVEPVASAPGAEAPAGPVDHLAVFNGLTDPKAKADYFAKHALAIYGGVKL